MLRSCEVLVKAVLGGRNLLVFKGMYFHKSKKNQESSILLLFPHSDLFYLIDSVSTTDLLASRISQATNQSALENFR